MPKFRWCYGRSCRPVIQPIIVCTSCYVGPWSIRDAFSARTLYLWHTNLALPYLLLRCLTYLQCLLKCSSISTGYLYDGSDMFEEVPGFAIIACQFPSIATWPMSVCLSVNGRPTSFLIVASFPWFDLSVLFAPAPASTVTCSKCCVMEATGLAKHLWHPRILLSSGGTGFLSSLYQAGQTARFCRHHLSLAACSSIQWWPCVVWCVVWCVAWCGASII